MTRAVSPFVCRVCAKAMLREGVDRGSEGMAGNESVAEEMAWRLRSVMHAGVEETDT